MTLMELSMYPLGEGESLSSDVARLLKIIDDSGLDYRLTAMATIVEGDWDDLTALLTRCFRELKQDKSRIVAYVRFDYRKGMTGRLEEKISSVEAKAGKRLRR
jgi:uncharacterized protein (TIGR00106 family)